MSWAAASFKGNGALLKHVRSSIMTTLNIFALAHNFLQIAHLHAWSL
jgi:hypothetical protein